MAVLSSSGADLSLSMAVWPCPAVPGRRLVYTLTIRNRGPDTAEGIRLTCPAPPALRHPQFLAGTGADWLPWEGVLPLEPLPPGGCLQVLIGGTASGQSSVPMIGSGSVVSSTPDPVLSNNTVTLATPVAAV